ncbi:peptidylprolyl isomerase [Nitrosovibrio tenuis]|uniref:Peptidyl-prolyl cis-trans isomerase n=1 Tax=Nitrosovibrio tenuis TaxID=1233 RepID=A0A1H7MP43_9PROT|nr:peptidylprolyl isomerase [Nitrosovibrio tenuis]SEL12871.1 peptidyl-prolyl cis-trans isomerase A (cyclophilin A)/peptidyl-prolyl cis-trans isomerase B (cyclophilin B) [Nitrosovibrio tenuis]
MHIFRFLIALPLIFGIAAHAANPQVANPQVEIRTNFGNITIELYPDKAPKTVDNFLRYVKDGYYNGTVFHRVIPGFMIQGGGFDKSLKQKPTRSPVENEAGNGLKNEVGTVSMARTSDPHSASAQFFINVANNSFLNHTAPTLRGFGYTVFGKVTSGMDVVNKIAATSTGAGGPFPSDVPKELVVIEEAKLINQ